MLIRVYSPGGMKHGARTVSSIPMTRELGGVSRATGGDDPRSKGRSVLTPCSPAGKSGDLCADGYSARPSVGGEVLRMWVVPCPSERTWGAG
jgi:hypothetical protein